VNGRGPSQHEGSFFNKEPLRNKIVAPHRIKWTDSKKEHVYDSPVLELLWGDEF